MAGQTVTAWSTQWAAWLYERSGLDHGKIPPYGEGAATFTGAPMFAPTADPQLCQNGQLPGAPMFYVPAARLFGPRTPIKRIDCTVPAGVPVFVTPFFCISTRAPAFAACRGGDRTKILAPRPDQKLRVVTLTVDGVAVPLTRADLVVARGFRLTGKRALIAAYGFVVTGLDPGVHVIDLFARRGRPSDTTDQSKARMTATLTVQSPAGAPGEVRDPTTRAQ
ncbi:MAG TPA: hypothetical protein PKD59_10890 [Miltoncostaeaceae bacterium]|nr:hypothetical protein [Miltoncostaeaceae bacterium]